MGYIFDPILFSGLIPSGSGGGGYAGYKAPVATASALPSSGNSNGDVRVALDTDHIWVWDATTSRWVDTGLTATAVGSQPNADGYSLVLDNTNPNLSYQDLVLQPADQNNPGVLTAGSQEIGGNKTFVGTLNLSALSPSLPLQLDGSRDVVASAINLNSSEVTGTLPVANGGTNSSTALNNNRVMISSGGAIVEEAAITPSQALASDVNGLPVASATSAVELGYVNGVTSSIQTQLNGKINTSAEGVPNGVATLDPSGKVPSSQLPSTLLTYQGLWDPSTNTPTLQDSTGTNAYVYQVSTAFAGPIAGLNSSTMVNFQVGNLVIYSSSVGEWQQADSLTGVTSVNGAVGAVTVAATDLSNLTSPTAINQDLLPGNSLSNVVGNSTAIWEDVSTAEVDIYNPGGDHLATSLTGTGTGTNSGLTATVQKTIMWNSNAGGIFEISNSFSAINLNSPITGSATWIAQPIGISYGGTGATDSADAFAALSPLSNPGDIIYEDNTPMPNALPIGSTGEVLTVVSGLPAWAPPATSGTVTSVSVVSANGLAGTVANATTTPALTLSTTVTGVLKGNGTSISAATAGTDYVIPSGSITGTASNITATSNSTLTTLSALSLPGSQVSGNISGDAANVTGTVAVVNGGTGDTSFTANQVIIGGTTSTGALQQVAGGTTGYILTSTGTTSAPTWQANTSSGTSTPTANTVAEWDSNVNMSANNFLEGYATTATSTGTTTLSATSAGQQYFTGSTTQTVVLPSVTTLPLGTKFTIVNTSTGVVTVQSSGGGAGNDIVALASDNTAEFTTIATTGSGPSSWWFNLRVNNNQTTTVSLTSGVSGVLPIANGGTDNGTLAVTAGGVLYTDGTKFQNSGAGTSGQYLSSGGAGSPSFLSFTAPTQTIKLTTGSTAGYLFTITTATTISAGDTYTNNGNTYTALLALGGNSGQVLWMSGASAPTSTGTLTRATGSGTTSITFTSNTPIALYTPPATAKALRIRMVGGGGGGGGAATAGSSTNAAGGGGGGAAYAEYLQAPSNIYYMIGSGGSGGAAGNNNGTTGGTTAFTNGTGALYVSGGLGGSGSPAATGPVFSTGNAGGGTYSQIPSIVGGNIITSPGDNAWPGLIFGSGQAKGGNGAASLLGFGGNCAQGTGGGQNSAGYGAGGGGAATVSSGTQQAGGNGGSGIMIIEELYNGN